MVTDPAPGTVKTRLAKKLGPERATEIYRNFVLDILDTLQTLNVSLRIFFEPPEAFDDEIYRNFVLDILDTLQTLNVSLRIFFEPPEAFDDLRHWLGEDCSYVPQTGRDLGQKMKNSFLHAFAEGFSKVALIGSDLPDLPADFINLSLRALDTDDVVL
ncbi:MAG: DUF2064 domain-containing protein, partial [Planctomycetota bacterium]